MFFDFKEGKLIIAILTLFVLAYTLIFLSLSILRYHSFFSYEWEDLAESNMLCWNIAHTNIVDIFKGSIGGKYTIFHVIPLAVLLSYFYIFSPHIYTLFFVVTFFLALAAIPLYLICFEILKSRWAAVILALAYILYAPKHSLNFLDGDSSILSIPILFFTFYFALKEKIKLVFMFSMLTILCKTESPLYIILFCIYLYIKRRNFKKINVKIISLLLMVSTFYFFIDTYISGIFSTKGLTRNFHFPSLILTLQYVLMHPFSFLSVAHKKVLFQLITPLLFLPLLSLESYIGLPSLLQVVFTKYFVFQRAHYISGMIPFLFIGTVYSIKKIGDRLHAIFRHFEKNSLRFEKYHIYLTLTMAVFINCLLSNFGDNIVGSPYPAECGEIQDKKLLSIKSIYDKSFYTMDKDGVIAWELVGRIPLNASVSASGDLLPQLSARKKLIEFLDDSCNYYDVDYILIHNKNMYMGAGHYCWDDEQMKKELDFLLNSKEWTLLERKGDFFLFKRKQG
jgi:uncharacterized membrane protein